MITNAKPQIQPNLLKQLLLAAKTKLENNTRFHDYAHAIEVFNNAIKLIKAEGIKKYDHETILAAALFHDLSNHQEKEIEGIEGAMLAEDLLKGIKDFPQNKINDVKRLIESLNRKAIQDDEILINSADEMAALSGLGLIRSMMISGNRNMKVKEALEWELGYIEKRFTRLPLESAKKLSKSEYQYQKTLITKILKYYDY